MDGKVSGLAYNGVTIIQLSRTIGILKNMMDRI